MFPRSVFLLLCHAWLGFSLTLKNHSFHGVAVVLHSQDDPEFWIEGLKEGFMNASQVIFSASSHKTFFEEIDVFADPSLNDLRGSRERVPFPRDVQIFFTKLNGDGDRDGLNAEADPDPFTPQAGQHCAQTNRLPIVYPTTSTKIVPKRFAKEWLKYRYGVFDEHGYYNDTDYPLTFCPAEEVNGLPGKYQPLACTGNPSLEGNYVIPEINYNFFQPVVPTKFLLLVDASASMNGSKLERMKQGVKKWLGELHSGSEVGVISFNYGANEVFDLRKVSDFAAKDALLESFPIVGRGPSCFGCAISLALEALTDAVDGPWDGTLVALTDGHENEHPFAQSLESDLVRANVSLHIISLDVSPPVDLVDLVSRLRGQVIIVPQNGEEVEDVEDRLAAALLETLQLPWLWPDPAVKIWEKRLLLGNGEKTSWSVSVPVEPHPLYEAWLSIRWSQSVLVKSCNADEGKACDTDHTRRLSRIFIARDGVEAGGQVKVNLVLESVGGEGAISVAHIVQRNSRNSDRVQVIAWFQGRGGWFEHEGAPNTAIHAIVIGDDWTDNAPSGIQASATVYLPGRTPISFPLKDNGIDPDLDAGDGIFSRDWPQFGDTGRHYAWLRVEWEGSNRPFHKFLGSFWSDGDVNMKFDQIPPNRITDLKARKLNDGILLNFTAAGNNGTHGGNAASYIIKFSNDLMDLTSTKFQNESLETLEFDSTATTEGGQETYELDKSILNDTTGYKYAAIQAVDPSLGEQINPSNIVYLRFPTCELPKHVESINLADKDAPIEDRKGVLDNPCPATYNASYCQKPYYDGVKGKCFFFCEDSVPGDPNTPADEPTPWRDDMYLLCTENQTNMTGYAVGHIQSMEQYDGLAEFLTKELNISGDIFMSSRFSVRYHTEDHNSYTGMNISWLDWETTLNDSLFEAFFPPVEDLTSFDGLPFIFLALTNPNDGYDKWKMKQVGVDDAISWLLCENNCRTPGNTWGRKAGRLGTLGVGRQDTWEHMAAKGDASLR
ncbi:unnamed protein product [Darwinula stevensoni]|uniref:VWFA domain-containing protein n=1 Tax=Darwinula stevensoni TaxID=69355 RepID=A0A7R9ACY2_9CRUS|nr:unnamed protein product [Darwinula stevensoni]CAG0900611.1 unnamed protein product [Darwinula stevensoni]